MFHAELFDGTAIIIDDSKLTGLRNVIRHNASLAIS